MVPSRDTYTLPDGNHSSAALSAWNTRLAVELST